MVALLLILISPLAQAYLNSDALKFGGGLGLAKVETTNPNKHYDLSPGFNATYGYRGENWEGNLLSYVNLTPVRDFSLFVRETSTTGKGKFLSVSFGPQIKLFSPWTFFGPWRAYLSAAPLWGLQSIRFDSASIDGPNFDTSKKITIKARGFFLSLGFEEFLSKELKPVFAEISYKYLKGYKARVVGGSTRSVIRLSQEPIDPDIEEQSLQLSVGIVLF